MANPYNDYTRLGPVPINIQTGEKDPTSIQLARDMRNKAIAEDVRETMARMIEWTAVLNKFLTKFYENTDAQNKEYYRQFTDVIKELSEDKDYYSLPEIAGARRGYSTLGERLNYDLGDENILRLVHQVVSEGDNIFTPVGLEQFMVAQNGEWKI